MNTEAEHIWVMTPFGNHGRVIGVCQKCGIVRRADDKNKPCPGVVKIALRGKEEPTP